MPIQSQPTARRRDRRRSTRGRARRGRSTGAATPSTRQRAGDRELRLAVVAARLLGARPLAREPADALQQHRLRRRRARGRSRSRRRRWQRARGSGCARPAPSRRKRQSRSTTSVSALGGLGDAEAAARDALVVAQPALREVGAARRARTPAACAANRLGCVAGEAGGRAKERDLEAVAAARPPSARRSAYHHSMRRLGMRAEVARKLQRRSGRRSVRRRRRAGRASAEPSSESSQRATVHAAASHSAGALARPCATRGMPLELPADSTSLAGVRPLAAPSDTTQESIHATLDQAAPAGLGCRGGHRARGMRQLAGGEERHELLRDEHERRQRRRTSAGSPAPTGCASRSRAAAGAGSRTWRAYLSAQAARAARAAVNARDRIGRGPWRNANGVVIAQRRRAAARRQQHHQADRADRDRRASSTAAATRRTSTTS